jgi:hypothetical protein
VTRRRINLSGLKPGSRQWKAHVHQYGGGDIPKGRLYVGIDFVCHRHPDECLGRFGLYTYDGADPRFWMDGTNNEAAGDYPKVVLQRCGRGCRTDAVLKPERVQAMLDELYEPNAMRVVIHRV